jgi:hypothetical protein
MISSKVPAMALKFTHLLQTKFLDNSWYPQRFGVLGKTGAQCLICKDWDRHPPAEPHP